MFQISRKIVGRRGLSLPTTDYRLPTPPAFTLVELIIAIGIFAVFMSTAIAAYLQLTVALKRENIDRKLYGEIESVITDIQRQAKFYDLDYGSSPSGYTGNVNWPETSLKLISHDGTSRIEYGLTPKEEIGLLKQDCSLQPTGIVCTDAPGFDSLVGHSPLTSNEMKVKNLNFYIHPQNTEGIKSDDVSKAIYQPKVTIVIRGEIQNPFRPQPREFTVQTSISLRHYQ